MKKPYEKPRIDGAVSIRTDSSIMAASIMSESSTVETQGQETMPLDDFTYDWED